MRPCRARLAQVSDRSANNGGMSCSACLAELDHCHGTLVVHSTVEIECTDPDCIDLASVRHSLVIDCSELSAGCGCTELRMSVTALRAS